MGCLGKKSLSPVSVTLPVVRCIGFRFESRVAEVEFHGQFGVKELARFSKAPGFVEHCF